MAKSSTQGKKGTTKNGDPKLGSEARTLSWCRAIESTPGVLSGVVFADDKVVLPSHGIIAEINKRRTVKSYDMEPSEVGEDKEGNQDSRNLSGGGDGGEEARLSLEADSLKVETTVIVRNIFRAPYSCDHVETAEAMKTMANVLVEDSAVVSKIAERIVFQILAGNIVWRNKSLFSDMIVRAEWTSGNDKGEVVYKNGLDFPLTPVLSLSYKKTIGAQSPHPIETFMAQATPEIMGFVELVEETLSGKRNRPLVVNVSVIGKASPGQSVYPSQAMTSDTTKRFQRYEDRLIISADKIQNALRRFDWNHSANPDAHSPIDSIIASVEPSGGTIDGPRVRGETGRKKDFYGYKEDYLNKKTLPTEIEERIYLTTCLIRGGVFVGAKKKNGRNAGKTETTNSDNDNVQNS